MTRRASLALLFLGLAFGQDTFDKAPRIVAIGDVHGGFDEFTGVLRKAGVLDGRNRWIAANTHLVQTGDLVDRGPASRKVMDLLIDLEKQARRAGGRVHSLLGNHEAMNVYGDLRYVSAEEYDSYRTPRSPELRDSFWKAARESDRPPALESRPQWDAEHPLGWFEHRLAFAPGGVYGRWIRDKNAVVRVNGALFLHGGISPAYAASSVRSINDTIRRALRDLSLLEKDTPEKRMVVDSDGPLWYRGLAEEPEEKLAAHVDQLLAAHAATRIVIGHTVQKQGITSRWGGKVFLIDVGLSKHYGGPQQCLVIEGGSASVVQ